MTFPQLNSRFLRCGLVLILLGLCAVEVPLRAAEKLPTPLPEELMPELDGILKVALAQSPQMVMRSIDLIQNEANLGTARSSLLPNASLGASYSVNGAAVASNTDSTSRASGIYYSASISQPLFRWGTLKAQLDAAKIQLLISQKNYAEAYRILALSIRSHYLSLVVKKLTLRNLKYSHRLTTNALALEEDKLRNGRISQSEIVNLRLQMEEVSLQVERATEDLAHTKRLLLRQAGLQSLSDDQIPEGIPALAFESTAATAMLQRFLGVEWEEHPIVQLNRGWVRVAELNYKQAKYRLYPMFGLGASISQSNSTSASGGFVSQASVLSQYVGVNMSWSIFDGFATRAAKISAKANQRTYERQLQTATDQLMDQATNLERQVGFAYRAMRLAQTRAELSESAVRMLQEDANNGIASRTMVEVATGSYYQSQLTVLNQRVEFLTRWSEFVSTLGRDPVLQQLPAHYFAHAR